MLYFNGFSLKNEQIFFDALLPESVLYVAGFSYGAQKAFEYVYHSARRVDRLILLSPAFFQTQKPAFVRTQLRYFASDNEAYVKQFLQNVVHPAQCDLSAHLDPGSKEELEALLSYTWDTEKIKEVLDRGTTIEVFFGEEDRIIDLDSAYAFFKPLGVCYLIKGAGHLLLGKRSPYGT